MLGHSPFYHATIRKCVIGFGKLFSDINIIRYDDNSNAIQTIEVPVSLGNREKWLSRLEGSPTLKKKVIYTVPRIGFEISGFRYDPSRKIASLNQICSSTTDSSSVDYLNNMKKAFAPSPWDIDFNLYVVTKTQEDALQIVEQILPFFSPQYQLEIELFPEMGIIQNIPINFNAVELSDSFEGSFDSRREIIYTFNFTAKTVLLGPIIGSEELMKNIILHTKMKIDPMSGYNGEQLDSDVVPDTMPFDNYQIIDTIFDIQRPI